MAVKIQLRRDLAANWGGSTVLASGEVGYETDTGNIKIGDGNTQWSALAYYQLPNVSVNPVTTSDLNNAAYSVMGRYRLNTVTSGTTLTNAPSDLDTADADSVCTLLVTTHAYDSLTTHVQQTLTQFSANATALKQWVRLYNGTNWTAWTSTAHLTDGEVTTAKIADDAVTAAKLADDATTDANRAVTTNHIRNSAVTFAKLSSDVLPIGCIQMFGGSSAPSGWLMCNGQAVSRSTYSALFAAISTTFGIGNGTTTFNVPNFQNKFAVGAGSTGFTVALGGTGGTKDAVVVSHTHAITDPGHTHTIPRGEGYAAGTSNPPGNSNYAIGSITHNVGSSATGITVNSTGSSGIDQNLPPYIGINYIIRAA